VSAVALHVQPAARLLSIFLHLRIFDKIYLSSIHSRHTFDFIAPRILRFNAKAAILNSSVLGILRFLGFSCFSSYAFAPSPDSTRRGRRTDEVSLDTTPGRAREERSLRSPIVPRPDRK